MARAARLLLPSFLAVVWGVLFLPSESFSSDEVLALAAFKQSIYEDPLAVLSDWNIAGGDPCIWTGVSCFPSQDRVMSLNLSSSSLKGFLAPEIGLITTLQQLVLSDNLLLGVIPKQIGMLKSLRVLDLSSNRFSGPIPPEIIGLTSIEKINLHSNGLTGSLPHEVGALMSLVELRVDRNKLRGSLTECISAKLTSNVHGMFASPTNATGSCLMPQLKNADFSYNFFDGRIPPCLKYLPRSSFQGNCFQDKDSILQRSSQMCGGTEQAKSHVASNSAKSHAKDGSAKHQRLRQPEWLLILEIITGAVLLAFLITATVTAIKRHSPKYSVVPWKRTINSRDHIALSIDGEKLKNVSRLSRQELEVACEDFSNIIGSSPDSIVYKGTVKDGPEIAVISLCISEYHWTSFLEHYFQTEVADLARLNHENIAKLLGYCEDSDPFSRMLIFEYASNGTLYEHLHYGEGCQFSWTRRMKIAIGIARGLRYLHTELHPPFTLSELNSNAVYLTEDFSPKLVDFESWKAVLSKSDKNNSGYIVNGGVFHGYQDSGERSYMDVQGNTFAFGVILLELISGRPPYCKDRGCLMGWAGNYLEQPELVCHLVDPELRYFKHDDLKVICSVVSLCVQSDPSKRPSMQILSAMLENGIDISAAADLKESPLAWAELALSAQL